MKKNELQEMQHLEKICTEIIRLLSTEHFAVLATSNGATPHASIISFTSIDQGAALLFITPRRSKKYRNLLKHPAVSLVIDARPDSSASIRTSTALSISGTVKTIPDKDHKKFTDLFLARHPDLAPFAADPANILLFIKVKNYAHVNSFNMVTSIRPEMLRQMH